LINFTPNLRIKPGFALALPLQTLKTAPHIGPQGEITMNTNLKVFGILLAVISATGAYATDLGRKPASDIDFNRIIQANKSDQENLQKQIADRASKDATTKPDVSEQNKVMEMVNVEVSSGKSQPVVDRRFNSVGEARVMKTTPITQVVSQ
jgi:hypothetical protein